MLAGIAEALHRNGHASVVLDLTDVDGADPAGLAELDALRDRLRAAGGHLTTLNAPAPPG
jgi:anti-anti-sigma regulatory factor